MRLNFHQLENPIALTGLTTVVIEDSRLFAKLVRDLYYFDEESSLKLYNSKNFASLKTTELLVIIDILGFDINSRATLKLIHQDLEMQLNAKPEIKSKLERLLMQIEELLNYELLEHKLNLEQGEITIQEIFQAYGIKVKTTSDSIFDKIFDILEIFKYLVKKKLLVLINVASYLTLKELQAIEEFCQLQNLNVLLLEHHKIPGFSQQILDADFFLYTENVV